MEIGTGEIGKEHSAISPASVEAVASKPEEIPATGEGEPGEPSPSAKPPKYSPAFEVFWSLRKWDGSKVEAFGEWRKLKAERDEHLRELILSGASQEIEARKARDKLGHWSPHWLHACRWLKKMSWENPLEVPPADVIPINRSNSQPHKGVTDDAINGFLQRYEGNAS